jgi:hypothetical protein
MLFLGGKPSQIRRRPVPARATGTPTTKMKGRACEYFPRGQVRVDIDSNESVKRKREDQGFFKLIGGLEESRL